MNFLYFRNNTTQLELSLYYIRINLTQFYDANIFDMFL